MTGILIGEDVLGLCVASVGCGIASAAVCDVMRIRRLASSGHASRLNYAWTVVEDIGLALIASAMFAVAFYRFSYGAVRFYGLVVALAAFYAWRLTVGRVVMRCADAMINFIRRVARGVRRLLKKLLRPIYRLMRKLGGRLKTKIGTKIQKIKDEHKEKKERKKSLHEAHELLPEDGDRGVSGGNGNNHRQHAIRIQRARGNRKEPERADRGDRGTHRGA